MAITMLLVPNDTLVNSGQPAHFLMRIANTDGAARRIVAATVTPAPGTNALSTNVSIPLPGGYVEIADSGAAVISFDAAFYAEGGNLVNEQTSISVPFVVRLSMYDENGAAPTSNEVSDVVSMSVVPSYPLRGSETYGDGLIDLESNNSTALSLVLGLI